MTLLPEDGKIDIGAVEYQNYRPDKAVLTAPAGGQVGQALSFSATAFDANGDPLEYAWNFGDGTDEVIADAPTHTFTAPGTYTVAVQAQETGGGQDSPAVRAKVTITALPISPVIPATPTLALVRPAKKITFKKGAKLSSGFKAVTKKPKVPYVAATASATISGTITLLNSKGKAIKGSQKITLKAGKSYLTFGGKWNKKALAKGRYTLKFSSSSLKDAPKAVLNVVR